MEHAGNSNLCGRTGCGSDENGITDPLPQGKTAQLELCLTGSGVNTKATGSALPT